MNEQHPHLPSDEPVEPSLEQQLTAFLLGEADETTIARVESALAADEGLRARRDALMEVLGLLRATPTAAPSSLAPERREALRQEAAAQLGESSVAISARRWWQSPTLRMVAALLVFGSLVSLWQPWQASSTPTPADSSLAATAPLPSGSQSQEAKDGTDFAFAKAPKVPQERRFEPGETIGIFGGVADERTKAGDALDVLKDPSFEVNHALDSLGYVAPDAKQLRVLGDADSSGNDPFVGLIGSGGGGSLDKSAPTAGAKWAEGAEKVVIVGRTENLFADTSPAPTPPSAPSASAGPTTSGSPSTISLEATVSRDTGLLELERQRDGQREALRQKDSRTRFRSELEVAELGFDDDSASYLERESQDRKQQAYCVTDGYGRSYYGEDVLQYLHRQERETPSDMFFRYYGDNAAILTATESLSTFAADVDSASYALSRAYLVDGKLPPKAAVRSEEFLNYFDYQLPAPAPEEDFAVYLEGAPSLFSREPRQLLGIGIQAREIAAEARPAMNLVFVIDKSGSMAGERMQLVKDSLELVIDQLQEDDTLGIVTFDGHGHILQQPLPLRERWKLRRAVRTLTTGGSTNAGEGLALGYEMIEQVYDPERINRVILASDGVANTGETDQQRILAEVQARAEAAVDLTTLGVGMGNHNDVFLEQLADRGDGSCHYLDDFAEAKRVLVDDFLGTLVTVGRQLKIQVEFDPAIVTRWRQLGYENRSLTAAQFRDDAVDAGEVGSGQDVVALYELDLQPNLDSEATVATVRLRWIPEGASAAVEKEYSLTVGELTSRWGLASKRLRLAGVTAQLAEIMRRSWHARGDDGELLASEAARLAGEWPEQPEVGELGDMIRRAQSLLQREEPQEELVQLLEEARWMNLREAEIEQLQQGQVEQEELLQSLRQQNNTLEARLQELLQGR